MSADALSNAIANVDWSSPDGRTPEGRPFWTVRGRIPFTAPSPSEAGPWSRVDAVTRSALAVRLDDVRDQGADNRVLVEDPTDEDDGVGAGNLPEGATGEDGSGKGDEIVLGSPAALVAGAASSTSVDFYGTEMSLRALKRMAYQMIRPGGIPYIPRHQVGYDSIEWDGVIGRTFHAEVVPVETVSKAFNAAEAQYVLRVTTKLYEDEPMAKALLRRLEREEPIGQSIGGWFTGLQVIQNEAGEVERVIVLDVELDHLAVTRAPANPDSVSIVSLRSRVGDAVTAVRSRVPSEARCRVTGDAMRVHRADLGLATRGRVPNIEALRKDPEARHIVAIEEHGDYFVIKFSKQEALDAILAEAGIEVPEEKDGDEDAEVEGEVEASVPEAPQPALVTNEADDREASQVDAIRTTVYAPGQTPEGSDALGSATPNDSPADPTLGGMSEERAMSDTVTAADIRRMLDEVVAPLNERLAGIEGRSAASPAKNPTPDPVVSAPAAIDWETRAKTAEARLADSVRGGNRVGVQMAPSLSAPANGAGRSLLTDLVARSRAEAPTFAAVVERAVADAMDARGADPKVAKADLVANLSAVIDAAEADGLITNPIARSAAAWK